MTTDKLARLAVWYNHLRDTSNDTFMPLFACESRYLVLKGGGGSGKSIFAGRKVLERCRSEPGHRFLVCRKVAKTLRESCFAQLRGQIAEHYPDSGAVVNRGELRIVFPNGSEILFAGLDDVEKLKSIYDITGIWIEEASELLEADFNQLDIRLRTQCPYYVSRFMSALLLAAPFRLAINPRPQFTIQSDIRPFVYLNGIGTNLATFSAVPHQCLHVADRRIPLLFHLLQLLVYGSNPHVPAVHIPLYAQVV